MIRRGLRRPFLFFFPAGCGLVMSLWGSTQSPIFPHSDPLTQREFQEVYRTINDKPAISVGAGAPSYTPGRAGDIYISTTTSKVYIATATVTSGSWAVVN